MTMTPEEYGWQPMYAEPKNAQFNGGMNRLEFLTCWFAAENGWVPDYAEKRARELIEWLTDMMNRDALSSQTSEAIGKEAADA